MHDYSLDRHPKEKILFGLALAAIVATPLLNSWALAVVDRLELFRGLTIPIITVPVFGLYLAVYWLFNRYLWKWRLVRKFLLIPDLNGQWKCSGKVVLKEGQPFEMEWDGSISIVQSWSQISIYQKTKQSDSRSMAASLCHEPGVGFRLLYQYTNSAKVTEHDLRHHTGAAEILINTEGTAGEGHYFTDSQRSTVGTLTIQRILSDEQ